MTAHETTRTVATALAVFLASWAALWLLLAALGSLR